MKEISLGMSNFDFSIAPGLDKILQESPSKVFCRHAGSEFNGQVYFFNKQFHEDVWVYGTLQETISANTLEELMHAVCSKYGYK